MRVSNIALKAIRISNPKAAVPIYQIPALSSISSKDLPNNGFGINNYHIKKTKYGHWPVYKKIQNTKVTTEIKRVQGDLDQFRFDLLKQIPQIKASNIVVNKVAGYINIKGDVVDLVNEAFSVNIKADLKQE